ncbi:MAG: LacI family DNA-binding transcriptional regulator [Suipraeoptans sp.]
MAVKAKDIAEKLGVSTATVSLVLNGKPGISDKTREKVLRQIRELGYDYLIHEQANEIDANKTIGFVIYKNNGELLGLNSFFPLILDGIELTARQHGYNLVVINVDRKDIDNQIGYIQDSKCAGYVIFATEMQENELNCFESIGIPFVLFDNYFKSKLINSVKVNNEQGTFLATEYLNELGHKKIGYLSSGLNINSFIERKKFAFEAIRELGLEEPEKYSYTVGYPHEEAEAGMKEILKKTDIKELPTAFLADNDLVAVGAMRAMKEMGYRIPDDFSLIGFDDRPICILVDPKLTTVELPRERFGAEAVEQLIRVIQSGSKFYAKVEINGEVIKRNSVGKPRE